MMTHKPPEPIPPVKQDRNAHEGSGDESQPLEPGRDPAGGGHRSGSRGAGTSENSDGGSERGQGPQGE